MRVISVNVDDLPGEACGSGGGSGDGDVATVL